MAPAPTSYDTVASSHIDFPSITPEKLAMMRLNNTSEMDRDVFSDPGTPSKNATFHASSKSEGRSRAVARTSRQVSGASRRASSFMHSHRSKMSTELTHQAENKFFSLIELMSDASREASSLKEYWAKLMSDRDSFEREREDMMLQIDEITETLEQKESQQHSHGRELTEKRKEVEKLLIELTAAMNSISAERKKVADRDHELDSNRKELSDVRITVSRMQIDHDKVRSELDSALSRFKASEIERDQAKEDAEKYRGELRTVTREHSEFKSKNYELTERLDSARKEVMSLTNRLKVLEREQDAYLADRDRLQEDLRKATLRSEETSRELSDLTERYDRVKREAVQARESLRIAESDRDEQSTTIERLRNENRTKSATLDDVEARLADLTVRYEASKREVVSKDERLRDLETDASDLHRRIERTQEEHRTIIVERDQFRDDVEYERRRVTESQRQVTATQETLTRTEATLAEIRLEVSSAAERIKHVEHERDEARERGTHMTHEIATLKEKLSFLQAEVTTATEHRDRIRRELDESRRKYEEVTETIAEYNTDSGELEQEINSLRVMLREAREQKERAISARITADRERDEYVSKYEVGSRPRPPVHPRPADPSRRTSAAKWRGWTRAGRVSTTPTPRAEEASPRGLRRLGSILGMAVHRTRSTTMLTGRETSEGRVGLARKGSSHL